MPSPVEGSVFTKGDILTLTFICGQNMTALPAKAGKLLNLTNSNNFSYNNAQITVVDAATGTLSIAANLNEAGLYIAQFKANNASSLVTHSPIFEFKVIDPIATI